MKLCARILLLFLIKLVVGEDLINHLKFPLPWSRDAVQFFPEIPIVIPNSENEQCRKDSVKVIEGLRQNMEWAARNSFICFSGILTVKCIVASAKFEHRITIFVTTGFIGATRKTNLWDASAHDPVGVLYGSLAHWGNFDECADIIGPVKTQFCMVIQSIYVSPELENNRSALQFIRDRGKLTRYVPRWHITRGVCVPASCDSDDLMDSWNEYLGKLADEDESYKKYIPDLFSHTAIIVPMTCTKFPVVYDTTNGEIIFWIITAIIVILCVSCGIIESYADEPDSSNRLIQSFSIRRNALELFTVKTNDDPMEIFHGLKLWAAICVYWGHQLIVMNFNSNSLQIAEDYYMKPSHLFLLNLDVNVEILFLLAGLLMTYATLLGAEKGRTMPPGVAIGRRFARIAPVTYYLCYFNAKVIHKFGSGPGWNAGKFGYDMQCDKNWWLNLLFLQSSFRLDEMCIGETWYISADFQYFVIATIVLMIYLKNEFLGLSIISILTVIGTAIPAVIGYVLDINAFAGCRYGEMVNDGMETHRRLYINSYCRSGPFWIGMLTGHLLFKKRNFNKRPSYLAAAIVLAIAWAFLYLPIAYSGDIVNNEHNDLLTHTMYRALRRVFWAIGIAALIIFHRFWPTRIIQCTLGSKFAAFMSQIMLSFYLVQCMVFFRKGFALRQATLRVFKLVQASNMIADLTIVTFISIIVTLFIERPFRNLYDNFVLKAPRKVSEKPIEKLKSI